MSRRKAKWLEKQRKGKSVIDDAVKIIKEADPRNEVKVINSVSEMKKVSDCLYELVEPIINKYPDRKKEIISLGVIVWNAGIVSDDEKELILKNLITELKMQDGDEITIKTLFFYLLKERELKFKSDRRMILSYEFSEIDQDYYFRVASINLE